MDAASGGQPSHGVTYGKLIESHADRIVVGNRAFHLPEGKTCTYPLGTKLKVVYTEHGGRRHVENITRDHGVTGQ